MVCHETYKDKDNKWLSPDEVISKDGKKFYDKKNPSEEVIVGATESMSKSKKKHNRSRGNDKKLWRGCS